MAVEMCKLSLWLVSLDRDLPFSFVDDKIFLGNSLLGLTSLDQLRKLHIDPSRVPAGDMFDIFDVDIDAIIRKAVELRRKLATEIDENDPARNSAAKHRQLAELQRRDRRTPQDRRRGRGRRPSARRETRAGHSTRHTKTCASQSKPRTPTSGQPDSIACSTRSSTAGSRRPFPPTTSGGGRSTGSSKPPT